MRVQPQYLQHLCFGKKEPGECNLRWGPSVGVQSNICKMRIQAFDVIVVINIIHLRAYYYLQKKRTCQCLHAVLNTATCPFGIFDLAWLTWAFDYNIETCSLLHKRLDWMKNSLRKLVQMNPKEKYLWIVTIWIKQPIWGGGVCPEILENSFRNRSTLSL